MTRETLVKNPPLETEALDDFAAVAWSRVKAATGMKDEEFTTRDRMIFELTLAWCVAEAKR